MTGDVVGDGRALHRDAVESLFAEAGWGALQDRLLAGLCHDLNGRVSALGGLLHLVRTEAGEAELVGTYLNDEVARLEATVTLLRLLPGDPSSAPELLDTEEMLPSLVALHGKQRGLEGLVTLIDDTEGSAPPVLANRNRFGRVVLLALGRAGARARELGTGGLRVQVAGDGRGGWELRVRVVPGGSPGPVGLAGARGGRGIAVPLGPLQAVVELDGGSYEDSAAEERRRLRYPALEKS